MKYARSNSLRTQQAIARYGKAVRHPVCQAWLHLWRRDAELEESIKKAAQIEETVDSAKEQKKQAKVLLDYFYEEGKQKDAIKADALLREIGELLPKLQKSYYALAALCLMWARELRPLAAALFQREKDAVVRAKDREALRALERVKKRWRADPSGKGARLRAGDLRELEILDMHRDKVIRATWAIKGGVGPGYLELVRGGDRPLSDEVWQGRFTVKEMYSHLLATHSPRVAGDKDGKAIRRTVRSLGIRPAEDQRGRKWKPPLPKKQEPKRPQLADSLSNAASSVQSASAAHELVASFGGFGSHL